MYIVKFSFFAMPWYSKRLDIVNERGLTGLFTISRLGCTTYFVENKFDSIRVEESNTISQTGSRNSAESVKIIFFIHFGHGSGPFFWPRIPIKFCPFIKYTRPRKIIYRNIWLNELKSPAMVFMICRQLVL